VFVRGGMGTAFVASGEASGARAPALGVVAAAMALADMITVAGAAPSSGIAPNHEPRQYSRSCTNSVAV
jgi:hypothetical protein